MRRCNAPSDDLRPSGEDPSRIAVIIDEAHSGIPDDGAFYQERGRQALRQATHAVYHVTDVPSVLSGVVTYSS